MTADDAREALVETMARAYYEWATMEKGETSHWGEDSLSGVQARMFAGARALVMLDALLAARDDEGRSLILQVAGEQVGWVTSRGSEMGWRVRPDTEEEK